MSWNPNLCGGPTSYRWITEAKANAGLPPIARSLGMQIGRAGRLSPCPACKAAPTKADPRGPVSVHRDGTAWRCWKCQAHGSVVDLVGYHLHGAELDPTDPDRSRDVRAWFAERGFLPGGRHA